MSTRNTPCDTEQPLRIQCAAGALDTSHAATAGSSSPSLVSLVIGAAAPSAQPIKTREPSEAEKRLALALKISRLGHTFSMAQRMGIYPT